MPLDIPRIEEALCRSMCAQVHVHQRPGEERVMIETPFTFEDGDGYSLFMESLSSGGVKITDCGLTLMHLSYSMDTDKIREGNRAGIFERVIADAGVEDRDGELVLESSMDQLGQNVFRFGQALTRVHDITFLSRGRVESTFYEDLRSEVMRIVPEEKLHRDYVLPDMPRAQDYKIDFFVETASVPIFLFGIPSKDKAMLTTIVLEHCLRENVRFESILVFQDQKSMPRGDLARLSNAADEMVSSLDARSDLERKLRKRMGVVVTA
jgi:hypothetical protein